MKTLKFSLYNEHLVCLDKAIKYKIPKQITNMNLYPISAWFAKRPATFHSLFQIMKSAVKPHKQENTAES